jgi:3-oxoacyl-[acyl-carrier protein] reductase
MEETMTTAVTDLARELAGQVAFVTGGASGIGLAISEALGARGARVAILSRNQNRAGEAVAALQAKGVTAQAFETNIADSASVDGAVKAALEAFGRVDVLVNNAGLTKDGVFMRMSDEQWDEVLNTNLAGAFRCCRACARGMMKARYGRIINISSVVGLIGNAGQANYAASKAGLIGFTKALALEVASRNITVNAVAPGLIDTVMTRAIADGAHEDWAARIPMKRLGTPEDVASAVLFLASDEASYITGHVLAVNGGMYL